MPTPMTTGTTAIRIGSGRRSLRGGRRRQPEPVSARPGGSSRGGRLKSRPAPSASGASAASGGS